MFLYSYYLVHEALDQPRGLHEDDGRVSRGFDMSFEPTSVRILEMERFQVLIVV